MCSNASETTSETSQQNQLISNAIFQNSNILKNIPYNSISSVCTWYLVFWSLPIFEFNFTWVSDVGVKYVQITYNSGSMFLHSDIQCLSTEIGKSINQVFFYFFFLFGVLFFLLFGVLIINLGVCWLAWALCFSFIVILDVVFTLAWLQH